MVALHNAGLLADDIQHEDPFVLFSGAGILYQYWVELRRQGALVAGDPAVASVIDDGSGCILRLRA